MTSEDKQAQELIKASLTKDAPSYEELRLHARTETDDPYTGFMHYYLDQSKTFQTMTTKADLKVTMELALIDQERESKNISPFEYGQ